MKRFDDLGQPLPSIYVQIPEDIILKYLTQTLDKGFLLTGTVYPPRTKWEAILVKIDSSGAPEFIRGYPGSVYGMQAGPAAQTSDSGFIVAANGTFDRTSVHLILAKLDRNGAVEWYREFKEKEFSQATALKIDSDGGYLIVGSFLNGPLVNSGAVLMKTDVAGNTLWIQEYRGNSGGVAADFDHTPDGGFILTGMKRNPGAENTIALVKTDSQGYAEWSSTDASNGSGMGHGVVSMDDGYVVAATDGLANAFLSKRDSRGERVWAIQIGSHAGLANYPLRRLGPGRMVWCVTGTGCVFVNDDGFTAPAAANSP